jgi:hypothetical protein
VELRLEHRLHGGQHHGKVVGHAPGHDRIGGDPFHGHDAIQGLHPSEHIAGVVPRAGEHGVDKFFGRRNDGEAVGPSQSV